MSPTAEVIAAMEALSEEARSDLLTGMNGLIAERDAAVTERDRTRELLAAAQLRILAILRTCAIEERPCQRCGAPLWFLPTKAGKRAPFTGEGLNHFADCPHAKDFQQRRKPAQASLLDTHPQP